MKYVECIWKHVFLDEPIAIYSELDDARWEQRKVEKFRNGRFGYANQGIAKEGTRLGLVPWPENGDIASDSQFEVREITKQEFEILWKSALAT